MTRDELISSASDFGVSNPNFIEACIFSNYVTINSKGVDKSLSLQTFMSILQKNMEDDAGLGGTPLKMPFGSILMSISAENAAFNCYYPGGRKEIKYKDRTGKIREMVVSFPNVITYFKLSKLDARWKLDMAKFFCTKLKPGQLVSDSFITTPNPGIGIFEMPFTNFHKGSCEMCYGGNDMPSRFPLLDLRQLDYYYQVIFSSPFNDDIGITNLVNRYSVEGWYKYLETQEEFPYDNLR